MKEKKQVLHEIERLSEDVYKMTDDEIREELIWRENYMLNNARDEGHAEGRVDIVKTMYNNGVSIEDIANMTNIDIENIKKYINQ